MNSSIVNYKGVVNDDIRSQIQDFLAMVASHNLKPTGSLKRLLCYALELLDNAQRYSLGDIRFEWVTEGSELCMVLSNYAEMEDAERLKNTVDRIMKMNHEEVNKAYKSQLLNPVYGTKGGAGLGYLFLAKKGVRNMEIEILEGKNGYPLCISKITTEL